MNAPPPFVFLQSLMQSGLSRIEPPEWLVDELRLRLVLLINHVLMQEPEAQARLARRRSGVIHWRWGTFRLHWRITPAGLLEVCGEDQTPDLVISLDGQSPGQVARQVLEGQRPPVQIEGDVQLAAEVAWLAENLRWDIEEDLARLLGDVPAHALVDNARRLLQALRAFVLRSPPFKGADAQGLGAGA
jgi:ubiquinone biosynthesis protein UbiJ